MTILWGRPNIKGHWARKIPKPTVQRLALSNLMYLSHWQDNHIGLAMIVTNSGKSKFCSCFAASFLMQHKFHLKALFNVNRFHVHPFHGMEYVNYTMRVPEQSKNIHLLFIETLGNWRGVISISPFGMIRLVMQEVSYFLNVVFYIIWHFVSNVILSRFFKNIPYFNVKCHFIYTMRYISMKKHSH